MVAKCWRYKCIIWPSMGLTRVLCNTINVWFVRFGICDELLAPHYCSDKMEYNPAPQRAFFRYFVSKEKKICKYIQEKNKKKTDVKVKSKWMQGRKINLLKERLQAAKKKFPFFYHSGLKVHRRRRISCCQLFERIWELLDFLIT